MCGLSLGLQSAAAYDEAYRPQFHFSSATNWLNDPNGLVFYKGTYHLFFQHNPSGINWGNMTWGHATSPDLVHWIQGPNAIYPDSLGTIFSGSAVVDGLNTSGFQSGKEKPLVAMYACAGDTSPDSKGKGFTQCLAYSTDAGKTWTKYSANPVLPQLTPGNRDPKVIWYAPKHEWVMALFLEGNDFALLTSPDLKRWKQIQRFTFPDAGECPDFFPIPVSGTDVTKWVFTSASGQYLVGDFDGEKFVSRQPGQRMDLGPNYYAVQTYSDIPNRDGRRIQIAWMNGGIYPGMPFNQQMSFPCVLTLHSTPDGFRIYRNPAREIKDLYGLTHSWRNVSVSQATNAMKSLSGDLWDLNLDVDVRSASQIQLIFRGATVTYEVASQTLKFGDKSAHMPLQNNHLLLRALIDRTSVELFGNQGELSFTACFLPNLEDHSLMLQSTGNSQVKTITVTALNSSWPR